MMLKLKTMSVLLPVIIVFFFGCSSAPSLPEPENLDAITDTVYASRFDVLVSVDSQLLAQPAEVQLLTDDRIAVLDMILHVVKVFDPEGNLLFQFGGEGRGPGEWTSARYLGVSSDRFLLTNLEELLINMYDLEGNTLTPLPIESKFRNSHTYLMDDNRFILETRGHEGALALLRDLSNPGTTDIPIGVPLAEPSSGLVDLPMVGEQISAGEIPDYIANRVLVAGDDQVIFILLNSYGELRRYSDGGELVWSNQLPDEVKEPHRAFVMEQNSNNRDYSFYPLEYALDMKISGDRLYILTTPNPQSLQNLLEYSLEGDLLSRQVIVSDDPDSFYFVGSFDISSDGFLFFPDSRGQVVRFRN